MAKYFAAAWLYGRQGLRYVDVVVALVVLVLLYWEIGTGHGTPLCYGDCQSYISLSLASDFRSFLDTLAHQFRPYPVPLIFAAFGAYDFGAALRIVQFQTALYFVAWFIFAASVSSLVSHWIVRRVMFLSVMSLMFSSGLPSLNLHVLSDSLSASLQLLMLALLVRCDLFVEGLESVSALRRYAVLIGFLVLTAFAVPARDTNAIFLALVFLVAPFMVRRRHRCHAAIVAALVMAAALATLYSAGASQRAQFNMRSIIAARVLTDPAAMAFFQSHGMPGSPAISEFAQDFRAAWVFKPQGADANDVLRDGALLFANEYLREPLHDFLPRARSVYARYLLSRPDMVLNTLIDQRHEILDPRVGSYSTEHLSILTRPCEGPCNPAVARAPPEISMGDLLPLDAWLALSAVALAVRLFHNWRARLLPWNDVPLCFALAVTGAGAACGLGAFLGDYWSTSEMLRHTMAGSVFFKLGCLVVILLAAESLCPPVARVPQVWRGWLSRAAKTETA